jgi:hypothetical protein
MNLLTQLRMMRDNSDAIPKELVGGALEASRPELRPQVFGMLHNVSTTAGAMGYHELHEASFKALLALNQAVARQDARSPMPTSDHDANMQHPVVTTCLRVAKRGTNEKYVIDADGERALERELLAHAEDAELGAAVIGILSLATVLYQKESSKSAAVAIIRAVGRAQPKLLAIRPHLWAMTEVASSSGFEFRRFVVPAHTRFD